MKNAISAIKNSGFRGAMRLFMPDLARQMQAEGVFDANTGVYTEADCIRIEDNGADITVLAFSGLDVLYAGLARYEFQNALHALGKSANYVFVRDPHRIGFHLTPEGNPGGLAYYEALITRTMSALGATRNIAIGSSIGGSAAFYFGTRCRMDQVLIFGAAFEVGTFTKPHILARTLCDIPKLFREPRAYFEMLIVTIAAAWAGRQLTRRFGAENVARPLDIYAATTHRPDITLFYGATAWPDAAQAQQLAAISNARLIPLPTGRHNTPAFLKQHGQLSACLAREIDLALQSAAPVPLAASA